MAGVGTYLFLPGTTEEAFEFYRSVFGTEFAGQGLMRFADAPGNDDIPAEQAQSQAQATRHPATPPGRKL